MVQRRLSFPSSPMDGSYQPIDMDSERNPRRGLRGLVSELQTIIVFLAWKLPAPRCGKLQIPIRSGHFPEESKDLPFACRGVSKIIDVFRVHAGLRVHFFTKRLILQWPSIPVQVSRIDPGWPTLAPHCFQPVHKPSGRFLWLLVNRGSILLN